MKKYKPTTPGRRGMTRVSYKAKVTVSKPLKSLTKGMKRGVGRNSHGRITTRHKGGGHKRRWREIDFKYDKIGIPAKIETIEYDPNRTAYIGVALYADGERRYVVIPKSVEVNDTFIVAEDAPVTPASRLPLGNIPIGTVIYNVEIKPGSGSKLARSAGNYIEIIAHDAGFTQLKMPSSEIRKVLSTSWACIGEVSNDEHKLMTIGKAGRARHMGRRPTVRGAAMNAVDHPHGGGEGKAGRGHRRARSKWGKPTGKGQKTRNVKKYSNKLIIKRRKVGKRK
ncbi:50S ribosomal protein L2 [Candidatus Kaiserbacteria bacterium]|nr:MAG: 50S ribosomal protein L2 [Candidatus Kaiserbacteria bacterium]PCI89567.1 MAG: 50S ribosomal protein L2 [Candidatus Kaiserbacteria bacterium]